MLKVRYLPSNEMVMRNFLKHLYCLILLINYNVSKYKFKLSLKWITTHLFCPTRILNLGSHIFNADRGTISRDVTIIFNVDKYFDSINLSIKESYAALNHTKGQRAPYSYRSNAIVAEALLV